jgi:hypothetical protein
MTPLRVDRDYAPVKYVSRAELRRLRHEAALGQSALPRSVRASSIPRLDALRREEELQARSLGRAPSAGRDFASPPSEQRQRSVSAGSRQRMPDDDEYRFRSQPPIAGGYAAAPGLSPEPRAPPAQQFWASPGVPGAYPMPRRASSARVSSHEPFDDRASVASSAGSRRSTSAVTVRSLAAEAPNAPSINDFAQLICERRGLRKAPPPPAYASEAFLLCTAGTYLVKYGRTGQPHERWVALRVMPDEMNRWQPFLVWALHKDSATIKDRINVVHLLDVVQGATGPNFARHLIGPETLRGPHVGSHPSRLPTDFAMSFIFQSQSTGRSVDLLPLDEQTGRCWLLVMQYFASINLMSNGVAPVDVETLAPESVRSSSRTVQ